MRFTALRPFALRRFFASSAWFVVALSLLGTTANTPPNQPPTPTSVCDPAPRSHLILHERARVSLEDPRPLNLRDGAGTGSEIIGQIPASGVFYVLAGPQCSQSYAWFRVEYDDVIGWIAEGDSTAYYVEAYPPGG
jgi:hypothetical protein